MNEEDLIELLRARTSRKTLDQERSRIGSMGTEKKVGNILLGVGSGIGDALSGTTGTAKDVLEIYNRDDSKRLKALDGDDGLNSLMNLYKIKQSGDLQRELQNMREAAAGRKEESLDRRFNITQQNQDARVEKTLASRERMGDKKLADAERREVAKGLDSSLNALLKHGYKFADSKASNVSNKRALEKMRSAREGTWFKGPIGGNVGKIMAAFDVESPEFAKFNRLVKDTVSLLIKERSGVAASEPEMRRLEATIPKISQRNDTFEAVLQDVISTADSIIDNRKKEYAKMALDAVSAAIPDLETREKALDALRRGANPVDVLSRVKSQYRN